MKIGKFLTTVLTAALTVMFGMTGAACSFGFNNTENGGSGGASYSVEFSQTQYTVLLGEAAAQTLSVTAYKDGKAVNDSAFTYSVADAAIAEVSENGAITPKAVGETNVTVLYKEASATAVIKIVEAATAEEINSFDEAYINTYGRVYKRGKKQLCLDHVGTGVELAINGTSLTAAIVSTASLYLCVYVDGSTEYSRINVTPMTETCTLVKNLENGYHTVRIVKSSESGDGQIRIGTFASEGFAKIPEKSALKIEFIGDSITTGFGALGSGPRTVENSDACSSYAYYTAQALNADYSMVALQGICVKALYYRQEAMSEIYKIMSSLSSAEYDFSVDYDVVVLNLGTNDGGYMGLHPEYESQFGIDYFEFLQYIREKNPNAYILCIYGMMGRSEKVNSGITEAINRIQDEKVIRVDDFVTFTVDGSGANGHPSRAAQKANGAKLAEYIEGLLK